MVENLNGSGRRVENNRMEKRAWTSWLNWRTGLAVFALLGLLAAARFLPVTAWFQSTNGWVARLGWAGPLIFVGIYALGTVLLVPGTLLTIAAGVLFGWWALPVVSAGSTLGAALAFLIARHMAREQVSGFAVGHARFRAIDRAIGEQGGWLVGLLRLNPVMPFVLSNYLFGLTSVRFWPYVLGSWLGMLPEGCLYVYLIAAGKVGLDETPHSHGPLEYVFLGLGLAATVAATLLVSRLARRALQNADLEKT